jgi:predicted lipoprotein with Yx(FWY)xxD motif
VTSDAIENNGKVIDMRARLGLLTAAMLTLVLSACSNSAQPPADGSNANKPAETNRTVKVADSDLGPILVDQSGRTLYAFTKDKDRASNCDEECIAVWPPLTTATDVTAGQGTDAGLLGRTAPTDGQAQATYGQWPLYYYVGDDVAGDVTGQGIDDEWFVLSADGKLVKKTE